MTDTKPFVPHESGSTGTGPELSVEAADALAERVAEIQERPDRIRVRFPAAAREVARTQASPDALADPGAEHVEDLVRVRMLEALAAGLRDQPDRLVAEVADLYRYGDADERRAVLRGLPVLGVGADDRLLALVADALRTNDPRLVAAALGPYAAAHLDPSAWRHGVLKCLFTQVPLRLVAGLAERTDDELRRMVTDYAAERRAAGRPVPEDALPFLPTHPHPSREP